MSEEQTEAKRGRENDGGDQAAVHAPPPKKRKFVDQDSSSGLPPSPDGVRKDEFVNKEQSMEGDTKRDEAAVEINHGDANGQRPTNGVTTLETEVKVETKSGEVPGSTSEDAFRDGVKQKEETEPESQTVEPKEETKPEEQTKVEAPGSTSEVESEDTVELKEETKPKEESKVEVKEEGNSEEVEVPGSTSEESSKDNAELKEQAKKEETTKVEVDSVQVKDELTQQSGVVSVDFPAEFESKEAADSNQRQQTEPWYSVEDVVETAGASAGHYGASSEAADPSAIPTFTNPDAIVEERAEISPQYVGRVIGRGGETIRDLQARSGCRMDVDQNVPHGNPRVLTYRGTRQSVDLAKQMVAVLCSPSGADVVLPLGEATKKELIVPASSIGKIIGRGGDMIRELQSRSQGKIQVDHTAKAFKSDTRLVAITGTPDAVKKAEEMILFLVANPLLDATMAIQMLVDDKQRGGQWGSGPPYLNMPNYGQNMAPVDAGFPEPYTPQQQYGGYQNSEPSYAYPPIPQQQQPYGNSYGGMETEIFPASKMYMGRIIGQKGVTINDLQKRSGCDIQINQDVPQGHDCLITIKGSRQGIEMVKQMLRDIIEMGPGHPYAGGGGQYAASQGYQYQQPQAFMQQGPVYGGYQAPAGQLVYGGQPYGQPPHQFPQQHLQQPIQYGAPQYPAAGGYPQPGLPQYGAPPIAQQQLPPGPVNTSAWKTATAADGQLYYYNEVTGETQWDKPQGMP